MAVESTKVPSMSNRTLLPRRTAIDCNPNAVAPVQPSVCRTEQARSAGLSPVVGPGDQRLEGGCGRPGFAIDDGDGRCPGRHQSTVLPDTRTSTRFFETASRRTGGAIPRGWSTLLIRELLPFVKVRQRKFRYFCPNTCHSRCPDIIRSINRLALCLPLPNDAASGIFSVGDERISWCQQPPNKLNTS